MRVLCVNKCHRKCLSPTSNLLVGLSCLSIPTIPSLFSQSKYYLCYAKLWSSLLQTETENNILVALCVNDETESFIFHK